MRFTFNYNGTALPAVHESEPLPWDLRVLYAWRALTGRVRTVGPIDVSHVEDGGYMDGRLRVWLTKDEVKRFGKTRRVPAP